MPGVPLRVGRYTIHGEIASGGMATVYLARMAGLAGFARTVAVKRLHGGGGEPELLDMFLDEARLAARIQHPNVVSTVDVVRLGDELLLVMEYLHGESLSRVLSALKRDGDDIPLDIASAILCDALHGLHAAHEAKTENGEPLCIVHRDVSPQNLLVGADGITRVLDFGVAKAMGRLHTTRDGQVKGKLGYMGPEQLSAEPVDRRTDVFAAGIVLWEMLTGQRLFRADSEALTIRNVLEKTIPAPSEFAPRIPPELDAVVLRALSRDRKGRFSTARDMATALEAAHGVASARRVADWLAVAVGEVLTERSNAVRAIERSEPTIADVDIPIDETISGVITPPRGTSRKAWSRLGLSALVAACFVALGIGLGLHRAWSHAPAAGAVDAGGSAVQAVASTPAEVPTTSSAPTTSEIVDAATQRPTASVPRPRPTSRPSPRAPAPPTKCHVSFVTDKDGIEHPVTVCP